MQEISQTVDFLPDESIMKIWIIQFISERCIEMKKKKNQSTIVKITNIAVIILIIIAAFMTYFMESINTKISMANAAKGQIQSKTEEFNDA